MALWENLRERLPLEGTYIEIPHKFGVTIRQMEISNTLVSFKLFNAVEGEFTINCNRKLLSISPNGEQLQINAQYSWSLVISSPP